MQADEQVVLKHGANEWSVRCAVLCSCSAVLAGIINDGIPPKTLQMEDVSVENVTSFLSLAHMTSYDCYDSAEEVLSDEVLSSMTVRAMPLVHKYDCKGILKILKHVQNKIPNVAGIVAIVRCDDGELDWLGDAAKSAVVKDTFGTPNDWMNNGMPVGWMNNGMPVGPMPKTGAIIWPGMESSAQRKKQK